MEPHFAGISLQSFQRLIGTSQFLLYSLLGFSYPSVFLNPSWIPFILTLFIFWVLASSFLIYFLKMFNVSDLVKKALFIFCMPCLIFQISDILSGVFLFPDIHWRSTACQALWRALWSQRWMSTFLPSRQERAGEGYRNKPRMVRKLEDETLLQTLGKLSGSGKDS